MAGASSRPSSAPSQARLRKSQPSAAHPFAASLQLRPSPLGCACHGQAISGAPPSKHGSEMPQLPGSLSARGAGRERTLQMAAQYKAQEQLKAQDQLRRLTQPPGTAAGPARPQTANARMSASSLAASVATSSPPAALTPTLTLTALGASARPARPATASAARPRGVSCSAAPGAVGSTLALSRAPAATPTATSIPTSSPIPAPTPTPTPNPNPRRLAWSAPPPPPPLRPLRPSARRPRHRAPRRAAGPRHSKACCRVEARRSRVGVRARARVGLRVRGSGFGVRG